MNDWTAVRKGIENVCCQVLRGRPSQTVGGNGSFKECSSPYPLSQAFVEHKRRGDRESRLGILKHSVGTPRRGAQKITKISDPLCYHCAAFAGSFPSRAEESIIIRLSLSTPSLSLSGFPNTTSPVAMLSSAKPSSPFNTPRM